MKKIAMIMLCLALSSALPCMGTLAGSDFQYELTAENTAAITRYIGTAREPDIPCILDGAPVTQIVEGAFRDCVSLGRIVLPEGVEMIGEQAFYNCSGLESVALPGSLIEIGDLAFAYCAGLKNIEVPQGVTAIGEYAFGDCAGLKSAHIPASVAVIGPDAFLGTAAGFKIQGSPGSFAGEYAGQNGIPFEEIASTPSDPPAVQALETFAINDMADEKAVTATLTLQFPHTNLTGTYIGEVHDNFARGEGVFTFAPPDGPGWTYTGAFENSAMNGLGTVSWQDGTQFTGVMRGNQPYQGQWLADGAAVYEGGFAMLQDSGLFSFHGQGRLSDRQGMAIYEGAFVSGYLDETAAARLARTQGLDALCTAVSDNAYAGLLSQPEAYEGKLVKLTGLVDSVLLDGDQGETRFVLLLNRNKDCPVRVCYHYGAGEEKVKKGVGVTLWGSIFGISNVTNARGKAVDMPDADADAIVLTPVSSKRSGEPAQLVFEMKLDNGNLQDHKLALALSRIYREAEPQTDPAAGAVQGITVTRTQQLQEKAAALDGKVVFDPVKYAAEDIGRFYAYSVTQTPGGERNLIYDPMEALVTVFVADGGGIPVARVYYPPDTAFDNAYTASGSMTLQAQKELKGRVLKEGEFSFDLWLGKDLLQTKVNDSTGGITFDPILYTQADIGKTYRYKISEARGKEAGITSDTEPKTVRAVIKDAGGGKLDVQAVYPRDMKFSNVYKAVGEASLLFSVNLQSRAMKAAEFDFEIRIGNKSLQKKSNDKAGGINFKPIRFTQEDIGKTYDYEIRQIPGKEEGMAYDPAVKSARVSIKDAGSGKLEIQIQYLTDTLFVNGPGFIQTPPVIPEPFEDAGL